VKIIVLSSIDKNIFQHIHVQRKLIVKLISRMQKLTIYTKLNSNRNETKSRKQSSSNICL